jgi:hypothetical protein
LGKKILAGQIEIREETPNVRLAHKSPILNLTTTASTLHDHLQAPRTLYTLITSSKTKRKHGRGKAAH